MSDNKGIKYYYKENELKITGNECPICKKKSWNIFKCEKCGKVFCINCRPDLIQVDQDSENIEVTCECGNSCLFIEL